MRHEAQSSMVMAIEETGRGTIIMEFIYAPPVGTFFNENIRGQYVEEFRS